MEENNLKELVLEFIQDKEAIFTNYIIIDILKNLFDFKSCEKTTILNENLYKIGYIGGVSIYTCPNLLFDHTVLYTIDESEKLDLSNINLEKFIEN